MTLPAPHPPALDTTGAGDTLDAEWLAARLRALDLVTALSFAVTAGAPSTRGRCGAAARPGERERCDAPAARL